jgi:hypothetical protein
MTKYTDSKGREHEAETMAFPHLNSAVNKLERVDPSNPDLPALTAIRDKRKADYEAEHGTEG